MSSKFDEFLKLYNDDRADLSGRLGSIDTKLEGISDFKKAVTEHEVKIKALAEGVSANHKRIKVIHGQAWKFIVGVMLSLFGTIFGMVKYLKHGGQ